MPIYEKPKREEPVGDEFHLILKHFYWRLFCYLMIPAMTLSFIFWLPMVILSHQPDRLNAQCSVYSDEYGIRIISETRRNLTNTYYWTNNHGDSWKMIQSEQYDYQMAHADCSLVTFDEDYTASIRIGDSEITIGKSGHIRH